jgi:hypothetical protein
MQKQLCKEIGIEQKISYFSVSIEGKRESN